MRVHLIDGTYELFRHFFGVPAHTNASGEEVGATRGVVGSVLSMLEEGATHVGVATDHVIESFRNDLWPGYKTGSDVDPVLLSQFPLVEDALGALGVRVWPMVEQEADDALAAAATTCAADERVEEVVICTPDKDLAQCVRDGPTSRSGEPLGLGSRIVQLDRRKGVRFDEAGVRARLGVPPASVPDWLALVGDSADGFPGLPGWGAKTAAAVLSRYGHLEAIPRDADAWDVPVRGVPRLVGVLDEEWDRALLFRDLATLRIDADVGSVDDLEWRGPADGFATWASRLDAPALLERAEQAATRRSQ
ncbi:MAG: flap endonuclease [Actinobacteria bacterium]|nr:flap endonuclease [Actinomycetota bacterium]